MPYLRCSTETLPEGVLVRVVGDVDLATAPLLADRLTAAFASHPRVILDLNTVPYIDSAGLHVLAKTAVRHPARFVVVQTTPRVRRLFEILGMTGLLPVATSLGAACDYLRECDRRGKADAYAASPSAADGGK